MRITNKSRPSWGVTEVRHSWVSYERPHFFLFWCLLPVTLTLSDKIDSPQVDVAISRLLCSVCAFLWPGAQILCVCLDVDLHTRGMQGRQRRRQRQREKSFCLISYRCCQKMGRLDKKAELPVLLPLAAGEHATLG